MSRSKRDILDTEKMLERLEALLYKHRAQKRGLLGAPAICRTDAQDLRRISMTLHTWHEMECGTGRGAIKRGHYTRDKLAPTGRVFNSDENGKPYFVNHSGDRPTYSLMNDREAGAMKRLKAIMARYPALTAYVQGDPRGCALYILKPGDVPEGEKADAYYSRGLAVYK